MFSPSDRGPAQKMPREALGQPAFGGSGGGLLVPLTRLLLVNLGFLGFSQKFVFSLFYMEFRGFRGFQEDRTEHTVLLAKFQPIWLYMASKSPLFNI